MNTWISLIYMYLTKYRLQKCPNFSFAGYNCAISHSPRTHQDTSQYMVKCTVSVILPFCFGRASSQSLSMPLDMARQMNVRNFMLLLSRVLMALIG